MPPKAKVPPRVCLLTPRFPPDVGGVAQASYRRAAHLRQSGQLACVLKPEQWPGTATAARRLFEASPWQLIHGYYISHTGPLAQQLAQWTDTSYVLSARGNDIDKDIWRPQTRPAILEALEAAAALTGVSRDLTRKLSALVSHDRCYYAPNSVNVQHFVPDPTTRIDFLKQHHIPEDRFVLGFVGEMRTKKGFSLLLNAFARLQKDAPVFLLIAGMVREGPDRDLFRVWQQKHPEAAAHVKSLPYVSHETLPAVYQALDLLVMPSFQEGMANAALEAMSCGVSVVATDVGGFPDLLPDSALIPPYAEAALYQKLSEYINDPERRIRESQQVRDTVLKHFQHHHEQQTYDAIYARASHVRASGLGGME